MPLLTTAMLAWVPKAVPNPSDLLHFSGLPRVSSVISLAHDGPSSIPGRAGISSSATAKYGSEARPSTLTTEWRFSVGMQLRAANANTHVHLMTKLRMDKYLRWFMSIEGLVLTLPSQAHESWAKKRCVIRIYVLLTIKTRLLIY
jgi:hypothetical protein